MLKKSVIFLCLGAAVIGGCNDSGKAPSKTEAPASGERALDQNTSYALGMVIGSSCKEDLRGLKVDYAALAKGFRAYLEDEKTTVTFEEAVAQVTSVFNEIEKERSEAFREEQQAFLTENSKKPGIQTTASGLQYEVITEGTGGTPQKTDTVRVHYKGTFVDGATFDSSYNRGKPAEFSLEQVIPGWTEGFQLMREGGTYRLFIPSELGYGSQGSPGGIPPYATLLFEVEFLNIVQ
ncbi:MAG: FKBP-type peptidyl-prolyl cis-trans isomerase [Spirochaetaceae bacterium]|jgi:FKBP-type peptidyl-prolyl cis-trans isomerase|nr:FKBP-type peptidyl-prolyl cis-trans isomerase [Spirochaetaceae bacterium]